MDWKAVLSREVNMTTDPILKKLFRTGNENANIGVHPLENHRMIVLTVATVMDCHTRAHAPYPLTAR
jgi:hypothetical protein